MSHKRRRVNYMKGKAGIVQKCEISALTIMLLRDSFEKVVIDGVFYENNCE